MSTQSKFSKALDYIENEMPLQAYWLAFVVIGLSIAAFVTRSGDLAILTLSGAVVLTIRLWLLHRRTKEQR